MIRVRPGIMEPIPHYEFRPVTQAEAIADSLRRTGWAPLVEPLEEGTHLYAARPKRGISIPLDIAIERLGHLIHTLPPDEALTIATAEEGSIFEGQTYIDYRGANEDYLHRLAGGLVILSGEARSAQVSHLRMLEAAGTTGALAVLGIAYGVLHQR